MADAEIGNSIGVTANGNSPTLLANVTADGANTVTIDDLSRIVVGMFIDIATRSSGAVVASNRQVTGLTSAGVLTYSGGDVTASANEGVYPTGMVAPTGRANGNGGVAEDRGFNDNGAFRSIGHMKSRLGTINGSYYTAARLNSMSYNDLVYAIRLADAPATIH